MGRPKLARLRVNALLPLAGLSLWAACSSDNNDFFGTPMNQGAGKSGTTSGTSGIGTGGSSGGSDGATGGAGGSTGLTSGAGGTTSTGGSNPNTTGGTGGTSPAGSAGTGGAGGTSTTGGSDSQGGTGPGGTGVTPTDGGAAGAGAGGEPGGQAGDTSSSGSGGTGGAGTGGVAGTGGSSAGTGTGGTSSPTSCADDGACESSEYCKKASCNAAMGTCETRPASCTGADAAFAPVCGCDHMTYFSVCVAEHEGTNVASSGECTSNQATCTRSGGGSSCSPARDNAHCYRPRTNCSGLSASEGVCWVLPNPCPTEDKVNYFCNSGGSGVCMGLCEILSAEDAVWRDSNQCN